MAEPTRIGSQLRTLRKARGWTQTDLAEKAGIKRTALGAYEEGRAEPRLGVLVRLAHTLDVSLDTLVLGGTPHPMEHDLRVLPIAVDREAMQERITAVSTKAAAGYAQGFGDPEWVSALPTFDLPLPEVPQDRTLRFFQIEGDSMLPLPSGAWILCAFVERLDRCRQWAPLHRGHAGRWPCLQTGGEPHGPGRRPLDGLQQPASPRTRSNPEIQEVWRAIGWFSTDWPVGTAAANRTAEPSGRPKS